MLISQQMENSVNSQITYLPLKRMVIIPGLLPGSASSNDDLPQQLFIDGKREHIGYLIPAAIAMV